MSAGRHPRPAPLLLTNAEIPDVPVHPVPGTVLKIPGAPDQRAILTDNQAKMRSLIILDKDIPVLCGNGFSLFAGKGAVRQPLKYSLILSSPVMPRTGRGGCHCQSFRTECRHRSHTRVQTAAATPAAWPYVHGLSFLRLLFSYRPPPVVPAEADR